MKELEKIRKDALYLDEIQKIDFLATLAYLWASLGLLPIAAESLELSLRLPRPIIAPRPPPDKRNLFNILLGIIPDSSNNRFKYVFSTIRTFHFDSELFNIRNILESAPFVRISSTYFALTRSLRSTEENDEVAAIRLRISSSSSSVTLD
jgi:hypothetical protein